MTPNEYLDAAREKLKITSDYALAKRLEIHRQSIPAIRTGNRAMPLDVAVKIAVTLEVDPAFVIADLEQQREKDPKRREFWAGFIRRAAIAAAMVCTLAFTYSDFSGGELVAAGGLASLLFLGWFGSYNLYYVKSARQKLSPEIRFPSCIVR